MLPSRARTERAHGEEGTRVGSDLECVSGPRPHLPPMYLLRSPFPVGPGPKETENDEGRI